MTAPTPTPEAYDPLTGAAAPSNLAVPQTTTHPKTGKAPIAGGGSIPTEGVPSKNAGK